MADFHYRASNDTLWIGTSENPALARFGRRGFEIHGPTIDVGAAIHAQPAGADRLETWRALVAAMAKLDIALTGVHAPPDIQALLAPQDLPPPAQIALTDLLDEVDESDIPSRTKADPIAGEQGRSAIGKLQIIGAIELSPDGLPRRIRLAPLTDFTAVSIKTFVAGAVTTGATLISDGFSSYRGLAGFTHRPKVVGSMAAHVLLPWIHRVFANFKRWALGTYHGVRKPHLRRYLEEFVFRWNRRRHMRSSFGMLIDIAARLPHAGYREFVDQAI